MDSRRLGLLLVAYLRGRLKPGRPQGLRSTLRKEVMLEATAIELQMESLELSTIFRAGVLGSVDPSSRQQLADESQKNIRLANELRSLYFEEQNKVRRLDQDTKTQQRLFQALDSAGLLEKIMKVPV